MPDAWEYPWYATWDLAFPAVWRWIDPEFTKSQLPRRSHPYGQIPASL